MKTVKVNLEDNSYQINIGHNLLLNNKLLHMAINCRQVCVVTDNTVADLYLSILLNEIKNICLDIEVVILPEGEVNKNQRTVDVIFDTLIEKNFSRDCLLVALGGGIVGDITGFAASCYLRGVDFIQIPTTLLAQVDSSVGGKTGINHRLGKNLIGAFYQPKAVFIDTNILNSLPKREIAAGMAEIIKYGFIVDSDFLQRLDNIIDDLMLLSPEFLSEVIQISCQHKANIVSNDEKENGKRAILNFGHTFGHAIEALTDYKYYLHGEAVAIGMMMAFELSYLLGFINKKDVLFAESLLQRANCPTHLKFDLSATDIRQTMQRDKKVSSGKLRLILLDKLGSAIICNNIDDNLILKAIESRIV